MFGRKINDADYVFVNLVAANLVGVNSVGVNLVGVNSVGVNSVGAFLPNDVVDVSHQTPVWDGTGRWDSVVVGPADTSCL
jgi:hypothetical protein